MIGGVLGSDSERWTHIGLTGRRLTTLLRSADGSRPGLAENSRYSFFKWMNGQLRQAGRFAINCNSLVICRRTNRSLRSRLKEPYRRLRFHQEVEGDQRFSALLRI